MTRTEPPESLPESAAATWSMLSGQIEAFVQAWEAEGPPPTPAAFVAGESPAQRRLTLIELLKVDLEYRWLHRALPKRVEEYLNEFPELAGTVPADLIYEEFHIRRRAGEEVHLHDYVERFPECARELENLLKFEYVSLTTSLCAPARQLARARLGPGDRVDDFDLLVRLGEGAFAAVFLARQNSMQRLVALKISADRGNEPQTLAQLDHDHIVRVFDQRVMAESGLRLLYMQYLPGGTLQSVVGAVRRASPVERSGKLLLGTIDATLARRGETAPAGSALRERLSRSDWPQTVVWLASRLARALDYAHRQGVLHRDIKPANVLLAADGSPRLADFNVSFSSKVEGAAPAAYFGGSLPYMSPEQLEACHPAHERQPSSLDGRSDIYSLGVMLWELLCGTRPFADETVSDNWPETLASMARRRQAGIDRRLLERHARIWPRGLDQVLATCLEPDCARRFATAGELARHLELCLTPKTRELLSPRRDWRQIVRTWPLVCVLAAAVAPNVLAAVFNYHYNRVEIVEHLQGAKDFFFKTQAVINLVAFPAGISFVAWMARPVTAAVARRAGPTDPDDRLRWLRRRSLLLGHGAALVSVALWLAAAPAYPIALSMGVSEVPAAVAWHFVASLALCGLIAAAYPFFFVACLAVRCLYPPLVRLESMTRDDLASLVALGRASWIYLLVAASVPMLGVVVLVVAGSQARFALLVISTVGVAGLATAFYLLRVLQADLAALSLAAVPPGESREASTESFGTF